MIENTEFSSVSAEAKLLFSLILDRTGLSEINSERFTDPDGNIFVFYTIGEICKKLGCGHGKAVKLLDELEKSGMISKVRAGLGKPSKIIVKPYIMGVLNSETGNSEKENSAVPENGNHEFPKSEEIYNNKSNTYISNNYPSISYERLVRSIEEQIEHECITADAEIVKEIVMIMADVMSSTSSVIKIGGNEFPKGVVVSRYRKLTAEHIEYVIDGIERNTSGIRNMKAYLISALYNAPTTMTSSVAAEFAMHHNKAL